MSTRAFGVFLGALVSTLSAGAEPPPFEVQGGSVRISADGSTRVEGGFSLAVLQSEVLEMRIKYPARKPTSDGAEAADYWVRLKSGELTATAAYTVVSPGYFSLRGESMSFTRAAL
jgi:hypothetical protein